MLWRQALLNLLWVETVSLEKRVMLALDPLVAVGGTSSGRNGSGALFDDSAIRTLYPRIRCDTQT